MKIKFCWGSGLNGSRQCTTVDLERDWNVNAQWWNDLSDEAKSAIALECATNNGLWFDFEEVE